MSSWGYMINYLGILFIVLAGSGGREGGKGGRGRRGEEGRFVTITWPVKKYKYAIYIMIYCNLAVFALLSKQKF